MEPDRFFFVHLQKTAGTTLQRRLRAAFDEVATYPGPGDGVAPDAVLLVEHLVARFAARRHEIRLVTGHFPLATVELLDAPFRTFTVLRDPVERTLSYLRHHRTLVPDDAERPLEDIYEDRFRFEGLIHNHQVKMLALRPHEMAAGAMTVVRFTDDHLARALDALAGMDVIGVQEGFEAFCTALGARFGWDLGEPQFSNRTRPVPVDDAFRRRIAADNALDVELHRRAGELIARRGHLGG
jgi:hypothetical protein